MPLDWDASSNMFIAVAAPSGGLGSFPALVKGDQGDRPTFDTIAYTFLDATDPTPDSATWTETSPGLWKLHLVLHRGPKGNDGDTLLTPSDYAGAAAGKTLVIDPTNTSFVVQTQKVGDRWVPASYTNTPAGNPLYTLATVAIPAQDFDWRPQVSGQSIITDTNGDVRIDLIARLNDPIAGNIVGRGFGHPSGAWFGGGVVPVIMSDGPPANASTNYDRILQGVAATIYMRAERISGAGTFTTTADTTYFSVRVKPIPYGI